MKEEKECKTSSVGTTFETVSDEFVLEAEEEIQDECKATLKMEVTDPTTEKEGDEMELSVISAEITECSGAAIEPVGLPWTEEADASSYESTTAFELPDDEYKLLGCIYKPSGFFHTVLMKLYNGGGVQLSLIKGKVLLQTGFFWCPNLTSYTLHNQVRTLVDAKLPDATELRVT